MVADFKSERWPTSNRNPRPASVGICSYIESFNASLRDECLNEEIFDSLDDARRKLAL